MMCEKCLHKDSSVCSFCSTLGQSHINHYKPNLLQQLSEILIDHFSIVLCEDCEHYLNCELDCCNFILNQKKANEVAASIIYNFRLNKYE